MNDFKDIKPDVPEIIAEQASPIERYLLDRSSVAEQQNAILYNRLSEVLKQTTATNGRVTALETDSKETKKWITGIKRVRNIMLGIATLTMPVIYAVAEKAINLIWP